MSSLILSQVLSQESDTIWLNRAIELAKRAEEAGEVPVGAVVVLENEIIGSGWNQPISRCDPTAHAEIIALRDAAQNVGNYRLPNTTLYVTLEPCAMCVGAMLHARISRLVFGAYDHKTGAVASVFSFLDEEHLNHRIIYQGGILAEESGALLTNFFKKKR